MLVPEGDLCICLMNFTRSCACLWQGQYLGGKHGGESCLEEGRRLVVGTLPEVGSSLGGTPGGACRACLGSLGEILAWEASHLPGAACSCTSPAA